MQGTPSPVVALMVADLHLSAKAPIARSVEKDWYEVMGRQLDQLYSLAKEHEVPVLIAGDLFDKWCVTPEVINFALKVLPRKMVYAVPGQHDLPFHSLEAIERTAYWTLVEAGKIKTLDANMGVVVIPGAVPLHLYGFPWGVEVEPVGSHDLLLNIAVVHKYVWKKGHSYPDAPEEGRVGNFLKQCDGFDVVLTGDNHIPFEYKNLYNAGTFLRRKQDERQHNPSVGLLHADGTVTRHYLDCSEDKFLEPEEMIEVLDGIGVESFLEELRGLADSAINFSDAVRSLLARDKVGENVKQWILKSLEV